MFSPYLYSMDPFEEMAGDFDRFGPSEYEGEQRGGRRGAQGQVARGQQAQGDMSHRQAKKQAAKKRQAGVGQEEEGDMPSAPPQEEQQIGGGLGGGPALEHHKMKTHVDLIATPRGYECLIDLPGVRKDNIQLVTDRGYLFLTAERCTDESGAICSQPQPQLQPHGQPVAGVGQTEGGVTRTAGQGLGAQQPLEHKEQQQQQGRPFETAGGSGAVGVEPVPIGGGEHLKERQSMPSTQQETLLPQAQQQQQLPLAHQQKQLPLAEQTAAFAQQPHIPVVKEESFTDKIKETLGFGPSGKTGSPQQQSSQAAGQQQPQQRRFLLRERPFGKVTRTIKLPFDANDSNETIKANYKDGVLYVCIARIEQRKALRID